jgi:hypothetical protein
LAIADCELPNPSSAELGAQRPLPRFRNGRRGQASGKRGARLVRQSSIENRQSKIPCAYLTVMDRNPEAVEKALMNKP